MVHARLQVFFDRDDNIDIYEVHRTGGSILEDGIGETQGSSYMRSRNEIVQTLREVVEILSRAPRSSANRDVK